jgi:hypothetical protein
MASADIKRLQDDLTTMKRAVGLGPSFSISQVWGFAWLALTGLLLIAVSAFPGLVPGDWDGLLVLLCWIALPVRGLTSRLLGKRDRDFDNAQQSLPRYYSATVLSFGIVFVLWTRLLQISWPITLGMLFFIEALPLLMVSVADAWRRSGVGLALALIGCGLGVPFVHGNGFGLLLGAALFSGCALSATILYWQLCKQELIATTG